MEDTTFITIDHSNPVLRDCEDGYLFVDLFRTEGLTYLKEGQSLNVYNLYPLTRGTTWSGTPGTGVSSVLQEGRGNEEVHTLSAVPRCWWCKITKVEDL